MTAFEQSMLTLKSENIEIATNIRTLFACTPDMLKLDNALVAESCVSYLYVQMMESPEPTKLCDIFADYIISYAKNLGNNSMGKTMIMNLAKAMTCLRGNSVVSHMEGKNDFSKHCKCFSVIDEKGRKLYGLI